MLQKFKMAAGQTLRTWLLRAVMFPRHSMMFFLIQKIGFVKARNYHCVDGLLIADIHLILLSRLDNQRY